MRTCAISLALTCAGIGCAAGVPPAPARPNVLFIAVDDWNDWSGALGSDWVRTPNFDRLAARGVLFTNAHCAAPVCGPSRTAVLTGMAPTTSGVYDNHTPFRVEWPDRKTLPQVFKDAGYETAGVGKIFHHDTGFNDIRSWSRYHFWNSEALTNGLWEKYARQPDPEPRARPLTPLPRLNGDKNFDWGPLEETRAQTTDGQVADWAAKYLSAEWRERPFFLAVGLFRPHWPWYLPSEYFDRLPLSRVKLPAATEGDLDDVPAPGRAMANARHHQQVLELGLWPEAVRAYAASIEFMDEQLGRVLDALERGPHRDNTLIVLWSDHGYHLGEKGRWGKQTLWRRSTRVPLAIAGPGVAQGVRRGEPVSLLDVFPTLVKLAGIDPAQPLDGRSLQTLLAQGPADWPHVAITTHGRGNHSVRTARHAYIRYADGTEELYDHLADPNEWHNLAVAGEHAEIMAELRQRLPTAERMRGPDWRTDVSYDPASHCWEPRRK